MSSLNKVMLIGNVGQEPDVKYTAAGVPIARVRLATNERWRNRETGEQTERTEWHTIVAFGRLAEQVREYVHAGMQIYVEGRIRNNTWTDTNGVRRTRTEIVANRVIFLGRREQGGEATAKTEGSGGVDIGDELTLEELGPAVEMDDMSLTPGDQEESLP